MCLYLQPLNLSLNIIAGYLFVGVFGVVGADFAAVALVLGLAELAFDLLCLTSQCTNLENHVLLLAAALVAVLFGLVHASLKVVAIGMELCLLLSYLVLMGGSQLEGLAKVGLLLVLELADLALTSQ